MIDDALYLATRRSDSNPDHHLWNNNRTWWLHFTLRNVSGAKTRHRVSLRTRDLETARASRDRILTALRAKSGRIAT